MSYDFPANPVENDEYEPPVGGQTYIYKAPRWLVKGIPPTGGEGGGGGIDEAPVDSKQYARYNATWTEVIIPAGTWDSITGKPATFPPTVPIAWTDVSGKPTTFPPTVPIAWTDVSGKPATFPPTVPIAWTDVSGTPATYPPTLPIAQSGVTNLTTDLSNRVLKAGDTMTGALTINNGALTVNNGNITALQSFNATSASVILAPATGTGNVYLRPRGAGDTTSQANLDSNGNLYIPGLFTSTTSGSFVGTASLAILAASSTSGSIALRPQGVGATTGQFVISTAGNATASGTVTALQNFVSSTGTVILAPTGSGSIWLRPSGTGSITGEIQIASNGAMTLARDPSNALEAATKQYVDAKAPLASPTFTGDPKAPTPSPGDNDTSIATTAFVTQMVANNAGVPEAPLDGQQYVRQSAGWSTIVIPPSGVEEAPTDGLIYGRQDEAWVQTIDEAPMDSLQYARQDGGWMEIEQASDLLTDYYTKLETDAKYVELTGDTMTGGLVMKPTTGSASIVLDKSADYEKNSITGRKATLDRWVMYLGNNATETGSNAGSNFDLQYCDDGGYTAGSVLTFNRNTGLGTVSGDPTSPQGIATKSYVDMLINVVSVAKATINDSAPSSPQQGQLWWNSADGNLYIYYNDGSSSQWVQINTVGT